MTTQDKPAVGPLSVGDRVVAIADLRQVPDGAVWIKEGEEVVIVGELGVKNCLAVVLANDGNEGTWAKSCFRLAPTAPVEAGGSEREDRTSRQWADRCVAKRVAGDLLAKANRTAAKDPMRTETVAGLLEDAEALMRLSALRPQPSGGTLQSLAQAFEDAMEGSHGAWAVSGDGGQAGDSDAAKLLAYEDAHQVALELGYPSLTEALEHLADLNPPPSGETREAVARLTRDLESHLGNKSVCVFSDDLRTILALIRPAAPGGGLADLAARVTAEVKRGADGSHVQALGALSNIEAMVRSAIPASEGGRE